MRILYSTSTCPKCRVLKQKLAEKNIPFEECTDEDEMLRLGIQSVPVLYVDGKHYDFAAAIQYVNEK